MASKAPEGSSTPQGETPWGAAIVSAAIMIVVSFLAFVYIPNTLLGYLTTRMTPNGRDFVVVAAWGLMFLITCAVFVRLQRSRNS